MKKYIYFILSFCAALTCKAQSPIYNIDEPTVDKAPGSYFKDLNGDLDGYDGTYTYYRPSTSTSGPEQLIIVLKKKVLSYGYHYKDLIVGEISVNGNNNTLDNININYTDEEINHAISGNFILTGTALGCPDCSPTEKRLRVNLIDTRTSNILGIDIRKTTVDGVPAIKVLLFGQQSVPNNLLPVGAIELGEYILKKRPW